MSTQTACEPAAPDLVEPVIGFRQWRVRDGRLHSLMTDDDWPGGVHDARCHRRGRSEAHVSPSEDCSCGVYAYYRPLPRTASAVWAELVAGAVVLWGELQAHRTGMRAQYARAAVLALPLGRGSKRRELFRVADELDIDVVPARRLARAALAHGLPLPDELKPPQRPIGVIGEAAS